MEVRFGGVDGAPAYIVRVGGLVSALVEIGPDAVGQVIGVEAYEFKGDDHAYAPGLDAVLVQRTAFQVAEAKNLLHLLLRSPGAAFADARTFPRALISKL